MRRSLPVLLVCALALTGCGERKASVGTGTPRPLRVAVVFPNAAEAPIYAARATVGFRTAGLKVTLLPETDGATAIGDLQRGKADLAVAATPDLLVARDGGIRVVSVAALVQRPVSAFISLPSGERRRKRGGLAALGPTTVGTNGSAYQRALAQTGFPRAKVQVVGSDVERPLIAAKVGAVVGYRNYQGVDPALVRRRARVTPVEARGVPTYPEFLLVANQDALRRDGDLIRSFVGALARSAHGLRRGEKAAVAAWVSAGSQQKIPAALQTKALALTLPLMVPPAGRPFGWQDGTRIARFGAWMRGKGLLQRPVAGSVSVNTYLPGEGL